LQNYKDDKIISLTKDVDEAINNNKPQNWSVKGNQMCMQNMNCYYNEASNVNNNVSFMNCKQTTVNRNIKMSKK
jgi:hypothetical protein